MSERRSISDDDELEIDLDALAATRAAVRGWRDAHARGSAHLDAAPDLFRAATVRAVGDGRMTSSESRRDDTAARGAASAVARAVASAPSPRVAAFLRRGNRHASEVAAAPELFCDAAEGVASAAKACQESLARAGEAYDAFVASLGGGGGGVVDAMPTGALLAAVPLGEDRRTAEQWVWLLTAVLEALARETEVVREVAGFVCANSRDARTAASEREARAMDGETLAGCAEVWRARAFVDESLLRVLADAEA